MQQFIPELKNTTEQTPYASGNGTLRPRMQTVMYNPVPPVPEEDKDYDHRDWEEIMPFHPRLESVYKEYMSAALSGVVAQCDDKGKGFGRPNANVKYAYARAKIATILHAEIFYPDLLEYTPVK
jgi:hypothetical protein